MPSKTPSEDDSQPLQVGQDPIRRRHYSSPAYTHQPSRQAQVLSFQPMPPGRSNRRCHFFDDNGQPRTLRGIEGCTRSSCYFVHPTDPEWPTAKSSRPPESWTRGNEQVPTRERSFSTNDPPPRSVSDRRTSASRESPGRDLGRGRDPHSSRHQRSGRHTPVCERSPRPSTAPVEANERTRANTRETARSRPKDRSMSPPPKASKLQMPPPPVPVHRANPPSPSTSTTTQVEATKDVKVDAWVERIKLMSEAVAARSEHIRLEREFQAFQRLTLSNRYSNLSDEGKTQLAARSATAQAECNAKKQELNSLLYRLIDTDFWPLVPRTSGNPRDDMGREMGANIEVLKGNVKELHEMLQALAHHAPSPSSAQVKHEPREDDQSGRASKRRRISEDPSDYMHPSPANDSAISKEIDDLREHLMSLEGRLTDIQEEITQHDNQTLSEIDDRLDARLEELDIPGQLQVITSVGQDVSSHLDPVVLQKLEHGLETAGGDIGQIAVEVADLITQTQTSESEVKRLTIENEQLKKQIGLVEEKQKETLEALERDRAEIQALNAAVTAYLAKSPEQLPPVIPSIEDIIASCQPDLLQAMHNDIQPKLKKLRDDIQKGLQSQSTHLCNQILSRLSLTLQTVETISAWMEHVKEGSIGYKSNNAVPLNELSVFLQAPGD